MKKVSALFLALVLLLAGCGQSSTAANGETVMGVPAIVNGEHPDMPAADLAKLTNLCTPENMIQYDGLIVLDKQIFALEPGAIYQFADGEKRLIGSAPDGMLYCKYDGLIPYNEGFYVLGLLKQEDGTTQKAVVCIDPTSGSNTVLFALEKAEEILALDDSYIYIRINSKTDSTSAEVTVFDWSGAAVDTFLLPDTWETNGSLVLGKNREGCMSAVTKDGTVLLSSDTLQDAALSDDGVYYLAEKNGQDAELYFVDITGAARRIGTISGCGQAHFCRQDHELFVVPQDAAGVETGYRAADLVETTVTVEASKTVDDATGSKMVYTRDRSTKDVYLLTINPYMGNCTAIAREQGEQVATVFETDTGRFYFTAVYDGWCYYYEKVEPDDNVRDYFSWPEITGCMSFR